MAPSRAKSNSKKTERHDLGKQSRGIQKRKSVPTQRQEKHDTSTERTKPQQLLPSPSISFASNNEVAQNSSDPPKATEPHQERQRLQSPSPELETVEQLAPGETYETSPWVDHKRKRSPESDYPIPQVRGQPIEKRPRISPAKSPVENKGAENNTSKKDCNLIDHWIQRGSWPREYFERNNMALQSRRKRSLVSLLDENSEISIEDHSQAARNPEYEKQLTAACIYMNDDIPILDASKQFCQGLMDGTQETPEDSIFRDDLFRATCSRYSNRNEAMIFRDITPLIAPSAELLFAYGSTNLAHVREELNTLWTKCISLAARPRPKPDFAVGLKSSAFTNVELEKLIPYVGTLEDICSSKVTNDMFFPFLTCETKCGDVGLAIADRQNAHSASIGVNAIVQLYKAASWDEEISWEKEINREVLTFSISNDNETVRIYGHYPVISGDKTSFHRHPIRKFDITELDGKEKWTAYKFTRAVYDKFLPKHLERVKKAVIRLKGPKSTTVVPLTSNASPATESDLPAITTSGPSSQGTGGFKKPKLPPKVALQQALDREKLENDRLKRQVDQLMNQLEKQSDQLEKQSDQLEKQNDLLSEFMRKQVN